MPTPVRLESSSWYGTHACTSGPDHLGARFQNHVKQIIAAPACLAVSESIFMLAGCMRTYTLWLTGSFGNIFSAFETYETAALGVITLSVIASAASTFAFFSHGPLRSSY